MSIAGIAGMGSPQIVSGASPYSSPTNKMSNLFAQIDTSGAGTITQDQFNHAFQTMNPPGVFRAAGADSVFSQLDPKDTGSVSQPDFVSGMVGLMRSLRSGPTSDASSATSQSPSPADTLASSLQSFNQLGGSSDPSINDGRGSVLNLLA